VAWDRTDSGPFAGFGISYPFANAWSLPIDPGQQRQYTLSWDFKERLGQPCILELQLKNPDTMDANGVVTQHAIHFTKQYSPTLDNWDTISASLDQFTQPAYAPFGAFDFNKVSSLVLNVQMLEQSPDTNVIYVGWFDNIRFHGPDTAAPGVDTYGFYSSGNDSFRIAKAALNISDQTISLSWVGPGMLQSADNVLGPWTDTGATNSPARVQLTGSQKFFRLRNM
jgi:hypothetical protein